ncbi:IS1634 family transposase [Phosphitispora fastidiosa]|uniref:IS1634 family transposase n=1 Tax=Phosphitispora fastidiosa TaxID=2837202 RepID=UPI001E4F85A8|nr:IS1634 family transposase [Phosphitispora fastidiosa]MBU7008499.1 transposase [Phosphitispora fastidiosa]
MATIIKKKIKNQIYYYLVESKRVNGKPKYTNQIYLGKAEDLADKFKNIEELQKPQRAVAFSFAAETALLQLAERLDLVETINRHVGKRDQGVSVGEYILLATLNRAVASTSKSKMADWFDGTVLKRMFRLKKDQLSSQRFWDNMNLLQKEHIERIEAELTARMVKEFNVDLECLLYDATNFFTHIDTNNPCSLPQRGHCKAKRNDLRIVNLALMVSKGFHIPLFHETYSGNIPDAREFGLVITELIKRVDNIRDGSEKVTLVFDKVNNSLQNQNKISGSVFKVVGSLTPTHYTDLLKVPKSEFVTLDETKFPGHSVYRTTRGIFDRKRTVLVVYNEKLFLGQMQGFHKTINKCLLALQELKTKLDNRAAGLTKKGVKPTISSVRKRVGDILSARHMKDLFDINVYEEDHFIRMSFSFSQAAFEHLQEYLLGKTLLYTDNHEWTNEAIITAYRGQSKIEDAFKQMKNPHFLSWSPQYHWTDQKIMVHTFYCVLALMLCSLLRRELYHQGIDLSISCMLEKLSGVHEVLTVYGQPRKGKKRRECLTITEMDEVQQKMFDVLNLQKYKFD